MYSINDMTYETDPSYYPESIFLVQTPDPRSEYAFQVADYALCESLHDSEAARIIQDALDQLGCHDPEAEIILSLLSEGVVWKVNASAIWRTLANEISRPPKILRAAVAEGYPLARLGKIEQALSVLPKAQIEFLTHDGLRAVKEDGTDKLQPNWRAGIGIDQDEDLPDVKPPIYAPFVTLGYDICWDNNMPYLLSGNERVFFAGFNKFGKFTINTSVFAHHGSLDLLNEHVPQILN